MATTGDFSLAIDNPDPPECLVEVSWLPAGNPGRHVIGTFHGSQDCAAALLPASDDLRIHRTDDATPHEARNSAQFSPARPRS
jgi:hypothetical protein